MTNSGLPAVTWWILVDRGGRGDNALAQLDQPADVVAAPGPGRQSCGPGRTQLAELRDRAARRVEIDVAMRADDQDPLVGDRVRDEREREQRRLVGGMQVVEHDHQRRALRSRAQQRQQRVVEVKPSLLDALEVDVRPSSSTSGAITAASRPDRRAIATARSRRASPRSPATTWIQCQ